MLRHNLRRTARLFLLIDQTLNQKTTDSAHLYSPQGAIIMRIYVTLFAALLFLGALLIIPVDRSFIARAEVSEGERLAMYSKPAVVRIIDGISGQYVFVSPKNETLTFNASYIGLGSGFFISSTGYIATNAHVVSTTHNGEDKAKETLFSQLIGQVARYYNKEPSSFDRNTINYIYSRSRLTGYKLYHHVIIPDGSVFPFEIKQFGAPTGEGNDQGKDVAIVKIEVKNAPVLLLGNSDNLKLQDHVTVIGYPGAADTFNTGTLDSKSQLEASITDGKLSARKTSSSGAPILQVSAPATHGNSGGPCLNDQHEVVGLLTFRGDTVNGQEVSGFSFVVASNTVMEYVKSAGADNKLDKVDNAYREGLDLYWSGQFRNAIPKFEEVKRLFPQHSEIERLLQTSQQGIAEGKDRSNGSATLWVIVGAVVLLLFVGVIIIAVVVFLLIRRRGQAKSRVSAMPPPLETPRDDYGSPAPEPPIAAYMPAPPAPAPAPVPLAPAPSPWAAPVYGGGETMDLSRTMALSGPDTAPMNHGLITFVSGVLTGQSFEVRPEGACIGRDSGLAQIVIADPRISKRHLWIGVKDGRVSITDQGSRNGTFLNDTKSARVKETVLSPGDTVILGESDVARFEYQP
jgi:serine protease Do